MIFGTVGTHTAPFDRLVEALDTVSQVSQEPVFIQIGSASFEPRHATFVQFMSASDFRDKLRETRVLVTHGGDTILEALELGIPTVAVPRRRSYGEVIDDHQVDFIAALQDTGRVVMAEPEGLLEAVRRARAAPEVRAREGLLNAIRAAIGA